MLLNQPVNLTPENAKPSKPSKMSRKPVSCPTCAAVGLVSLVGWLTSMFNEVLLVGTSSRTSQRCNWPSKEPLSAAKERSKELSMDQTDI